MLYGISLLYGFGGTLNLFTGDLLPNLLAANPTAVYAAFTLFFVGIGFKLSFVPVHFWVPDIYQGAPTPVSAFLSILPKIAAFSLLVNFLTPFIYYGRWDLHAFSIGLSVVGIATMIVGNFAATLQTNVKRMLAYSSIGHTGFVLMALVTFNSTGVSAVIFYLAAYAIASAGAWMLASYFADAAGAEDLNGYKGLGFKYPVASVCFVIILISLTGIPLTVGFTGKLLTFSVVYSAYKGGHDIWMLLLMVTGAITTVVSLFYYIKIPLNLFLRKTDRTSGFAAPSKAILVVVAIITILVVYFAIIPGFLYVNL
jgi:NADH-quinone oxidoreductase subunit N